jgi:hypothetical protein
MNMCLIVSGYRDRAVCISRPNSVRFFLVSLNAGRSLQKKGGIHETNCSLAFRMLLPARRYVKINSDEQHAIFAHELQRALRLTVGFSNIYSDLQQICHLSITLNKIDSK